jgi:hypothetical protein
MTRDLHTLLDHNNSMKRLTTFVMILWLGVVSPSSADLLKSPPMAATEEKGTTVTRTKGSAARSKAQWSIEKTKSDGRDVVKMTETGQGAYSGFNQEVRWNIEAYWSTGDAFRPLRFQKTVTDKSGKSLVQEMKQFNWTKHQVRFERRDLKDGKTTAKVMTIPDDTLTVEGIAAALRALPFETKRPFAAHFLTNEPKLYDITLEVRGREKIQTAAGSFDCYKVELVPHVGALDAFRFLFPKAYFWFTVDPLHTWIRFQGPENGPSSQEIIIEKTG